MRVRTSEAITYNHHRCVTIITYTNANIVILCLYISTLICENTPKRQHKIVLLLRVKSCAGDKLCSQFPLDLLTHIAWIMKHESHVHGIIHRVIVIVIYCFVYCLYRSAYVARVMHSVQCNLCSVYIESFKLSVPEAIRTSCVSSWAVGTTNGGSIDAVANNAVGTAVAKKSGAGGVEAAATRGVPAAGFTGAM
jgi:hypothetical protein